MSSRRKRVRRGRRIEGRPSPRHLHRPEHRPIAKSRRHSENLRPHWGSRGGGIWQSTTPYNEGFLTKRGAGRIEEVPDETDSVEEELHRGGHLGFNAGKGGKTGPEFDKLVVRLSQNGDFLMLVKPQR